MTEFSNFQRHATFFGNDFENYLLGQAVHLHVYSIVNVKPFSRFEMVANLIGRYLEGGNTAWFKCLEGISDQ